MGDGESSALIWRIVTVCTSISTMYSRAACPRSELKVEFRMADMRMERETQRLRA